MTTAPDGDSTGPATGVAAAGRAGDDIAAGEASDDDGGRRRGSARPRWRRPLIGIGVAVLLLVVAGLVGLRALAGGPESLTLPAQPAREGDAPGAMDLSGTWRVDEGSTVGFRVDQIVVGTRSPIVGRTDQVAGSLAIEGSTVTAAAFTVDLEDLAANDSQRAAFGVERHPEAELVLVEPVTIDEPAADGVAADHHARADLSFNGTTRTIDLTVTARPSPEAIDLLATIPVDYGAWGIHIDGLGPIASLDPTAEVEVLLHLTRR